MTLTVLHLIDFSFFFFPTEVAVCQISTCHKDQYNYQLQGHCLYVDLYDFINLFTLSGVITKAVVTEKKFCETLLLL